MSKKQVIVLWLVAIVLAAAAVIVKWRGPKGFESHMARSRGQTLFAEFPAKDAAKIEVSSGADKVTVVRKNGDWVLPDRGDYPANHATINELLRTLAEVKVTDGIEATPSFAPRFGMDPAATKKEERGTEIVISNEAGAEIAHVTLGKSISSSDDAEAMMMGMGGNSGRFIRNHADSSGIYKVSEMFGALSTETPRWLSTDFLKIDKIKDIAVSPAGKPSDIAWKLTRPEENAEFALEGKKDEEVLDTTVTGALKNVLASSTFEDVVPADKVPALEVADEKRTVKIETFEGLTYTLAVTPTVPEAPKEGTEAPATDKSYLVTVEVAGNVPAERKKDEKETSEDAKTKDQAFTDRKAELEKRLAAAKNFQGRVFKVSSWTVESLLKDRAGLLQKPGQAGVASPGANPGLPPGFAPQGGAPRRPVEAVTPPIAIPPLEEEEQPKEAPPETDKPQPEAKPQPAPPAQESTPPDAPAPPQPEPQPEPQPGEGQ